MHPHRPQSSPGKGVPARLALAAFALYAVLQAVPLEAGTELDHPGSAIPSAPDTTAAPAALATDPLSFDPVELWMTYYHRKPTPERIPEMIRPLVAKGAFAADAPRAREYLRFFSAAANSQLDTIPALKAAAESAAAQEKAILLAVAAKASHYSSPPLEKPADIAQLWAEYQATGSESSIRAVIDLVGLEPAADPNGLAAAAAASLAEQVPRQPPARDVLNDVYLLANEPLKSRLNSLVQAVNRRYELARMAEGRGDNHVVAKQLEEAIKAYLVAIEIYPAYRWPYTDLARIILNEKRESEYPRAHAAVQIAVALEPENGDVLELVGQYYYRTKEPDQAYSWFARAEECAPRDEYPPFMRGLIALERKDEKTALRHFTRYLKLDPGGDRLKKDTLRLLAANGVKPLPPPDRDLMKLLKKKDFAGLNGRIQDLARQRPTGPTGTSRLFEAFYALTEMPNSDGASDDRIKLFRDWAAEQPTSWIAMTALGNALVKYAWKARGTGYADTVLDDRGRLFKERLLEARAVLEKAYELDPGQPTASTFMIEVVKGLGLGREELEKHFQRAIQADASVLPPFVRKLQVLLPKWGGSAEESLAFARASAAAAPPGSRIPLVLPDAHWELDGDLQRSRHDRGYYRNPEVWNELKLLYERHLASFPKDDENRNRFAWVAYRAGEFETARRLLDEIGEEWDPAVWGNFTVLRKARKEMAAR